tara:strand:+ start:381 stop:770 length:390 start_codon:yes stop_codon:yes gene_type:complete
MKNKIILPSNKKFGLFFSSIFFLVFVYFFLFKDEKIFYILFISIAFFLISILKPEILQKLNYLWFKFGILLGSIFSPVILGIIFFFIISPIAIFMKIINRDMLKKNFNSKKNTYWEIQEKKYINMKDQF